MAETTTYTKTLKLNTEVDKKQWLAFKNDFKKMQENKIFDTKELDKLAEAYADAKSNMEKINQLKHKASMISLYGSKEDKAQLKNIKKELVGLQKNVTDEEAKSFDIKGAIGSKILSTFKRGGEIAADFIKTSFNEAIKEISTMSTYNYGTSLFQDSSSRESALKYGLSGNQAYAFDKTMQFMGMSSEEDLMYMNENQQKLFAEKIGYYTDKYNSLNNSGFLESWDRFQVEYKNFKEEMMYEIVDWVMHNKDTIKAGIQLVTEGMKMLIQLVGSIAQFFLGKSTNSSSISSRTSDIVNQYKSSSTNNNVNISNNFNGITASNRTELANAGEMTYKQTLSAIKALR